MNIKFKTINYAKGFSFVEVVIVVSITSLLMVLISSLVIDVFVLPKQQYLSLDNVDNARIVATRFVNEIRSAVRGVNGSPAISTANNTDIILYSPAGGGGSSIKRIRYFVSGNSLYKGVVIPTGNPLDYNLAQESVSKVLSDLSIGANPLFNYYGGSYDGDTVPLVQPVNINDIRFVRINLIVLKQSKSGSNSTFNLSTGAAIRSLKDNLGN